MKDGVKIPETRRARFPGISFLQRRLGGDLL